MIPASATAPSVLARPCTVAEMISFWKQLLVSECMPNSPGLKGVMKRKTFTDFLRDAYAPRKTPRPGFLRGRICLQPNDYHFLKMILFPSPLSYTNSKVIVQTSHAKHCGFCRKNLNNKRSIGCKQAECGDWANLAESKESKQIISLLVFHHVLRK